MSFSQLFERCKQKRSETIQKDERLSSSNLTGPTADPEDDSRQLVGAGKRKRKRKEKQGNQSSSKDGSGKKWGKRQRPSEEALQLSEQLKTLSRNKQLLQALKLYWECTSRDQFHACILIDCCAKCGSIEDAEKIVFSSEVANTEMQTALLKAYALAGDMYKADTLFERMCRSESGSPPNIRTLNTILRGCLWTAASEKDGKIVGGVITSEKAWNLFRETIGKQHLDSSAYEYSVSLLCQALNLEEAEKRIQEFQAENQIRVKGKASLVGGDTATLETLAVLYLAFARSHALVGNMNETWTACQRALNAVNASRALLTQALPVSIKNHDKTPQHPGSGGKRSSKSTVSDSNDVRRSESNNTFRHHRLTEIEMDVRKVLKMRGESSKRPGKQELARKLVTRLFYCSGGGITSVKVANGQKLTPSGREASFSGVATWFSFGRSRLSTSEKCADCTFPLREDSTIDLHRVFGNQHEVDIELGAGSGDWVLARASAEPHRNYVAVEMRADRVYSIFAKSVLDPAGPLDNLFVVGSEAGSFLRHHVGPATVTNVFVHHPEPPTQTFGDDQRTLESIMTAGDEPGHMLCSGTILAAARCLRRDGMLVIVTDNRSYARLLGATLVRVVRQNPCLLRIPKEIDVKKWGLRKLDLIGGTVPLYQGTSSNLSTSRNRDENAGGVTWFDRLWKSGASAHAERNTRFVLVMHRSTSK